MHRRTALMTAAMLLAAAPAAHARTTTLRVSPSAAAVRAAVELRGPAVLRAQGVKVTVGGRPARVLRRRGGTLRIQVPPTARPGVRDVLVRAGRRRASSTLRILKPFKGRIGAKLDSARAKSATIGPAGGAISATGADGISYELRVPAGGLPTARKLTITPVSRFIGLPLTAGRGAGVALAPAGLRFAVPATLVMTARRAWPRRSVGFGASATEGFEISAPQRSGRVLRVSVPHFSEAGAAPISEADLAALAQGLLAKPDPLSLTDSRQAVKLVQTFELVLGSAFCALEPACPALRTKAEKGLAAAGKALCARAKGAPEPLVLNELVAFEGEAQSFGTSLDSTTLRCAEEVLGTIVDDAVTRATRSPLGPRGPVGVIPAGIHADLDGDGFLTNLEFLAAIAALGRTIDPSIAVRAQNAFNSLFDKLVTDAPENCLRDRDGTDRDLRKLLRYANDLLFRVEDVAKAIEACGVAVAVTPGSVTLAPQTTQQFAAQVTGVDDDNAKDVTWTATSGTIDKNGLYTAPADPGTYEVRATSAINTARFGVATVVVAGSCTLPAPPASRSSRTSRVVQSGDVVVQTAADVQALKAAGVTEITGKLTIGQPSTVQADPPSAVPSLAGLEGLTTIGGDLVIRRTSVLADVLGLQGLRQVGGRLDISSNAALASLDGLQGISDVDALVVFDDHALTDISGLCSLGHVGGGVTLFGTALRSLSGLDALAQIDGSLTIGFNNLESMTGLGGLTRVEGTVAFLESGLTSLAGLEHLSHAGTITVQSVPAFNLPALKTVADSIDMTSDVRLQTVDLPLLEKVGDSLGGSNGDVTFFNTHVTSFHAPKLVDLLSLEIWNNQADLNVELGPAAHLRQWLQLVDNIGHSITVSPISSVDVQVEGNRNSNVAATLTIGSTPSLQFTCNEGVGLANVKITSAGTAQIRDNVGFTDQQAMGYAASIGATPNPISGNIASGAAIC